jgi:hypothetical protein
MIHVPRGVFNSLVDEEVARFEEEIASSLNPDVIPFEVIDARKRLEDKFGEKAGYVLGRLSYAEINNVAYTPMNPVELIKDLSKKDLRIEIVAEKLGL